eukprot:Blabericola_migrator_1__9942@NODE_549_length_7677_cov_63_036137_g107_i1_p1_GENE_NODE_549_length_7677_cov_63_036137_g107_i1NODE_549_length_7677_cov_63_036137_g107_i1_p1_ORF_typecomplete_len695_score170_84_NODE_549_length_7677_cov_63_036137_g107_i1132097
MARKRLRRSKTSVVSTVKADRVNKLLALHGLLPGTKPESYSTHELVQQIESQDLTQSEPACAIVATLFDIATEDPSADMRNHLKTLLQSGLCVAIQTPWLDGRARRVADEELPKKTSSLIVLKSIFGYLSTAPQADVESAAMLLNDNFQLQLAQSLEEALSCVADPGKAKYQNHALRYARALFSCLTAACVPFPVLVTEFSKTLFAGLFKEQSVIYVALQLAVRGLDEVVCAPMSSTGTLDKATYLMAALRASAAEYVSNVAQSLSAPEGIDGAYLKEYMKNELKLFEAVTPEEIKQLADFITMLEVIRRTLFVMNACLEWELTGILDDVKAFIAKALACILQTDSEGVLIMARIAQVCTEQAEKTSTTLPDTKDFGSFIHMLDLALTTVETAVAIYQDDVIQANSLPANIDAWIRKHFVPVLSSTYASLKVVKELESTAKTTFLQYMGYMASATGQVVETEVTRLLQMRQEEISNITFGARKTKLKAALESLNILITWFDIKDEADNADVLLPWEMALGLGLELWYVTYQSAISDGLIEQYSEAAKYLSDEVDDLVMEKVPENIQNLLGVLAPKYLVEHPFELKKARSSQVEFCRWLLLCTSLVGQLCPVILPEAVKVAAVDVALQILQFAISDKDEFALRHYGIAIIAEAMFAIMDNLAGVWVPYISLPLISFHFRGWFSSSVPSHAYCRPH